MTLRRVGKKKAARVGKLHMGVSSSRSQAAFIANAERVLADGTIHSPDAVEAVQKLVGIAKSDLPARVKDKFFENAKAQFRDWLNVEQAKVSPDDATRLGLLSLGPESPEGVAALTEMVKVARSKDLSKEQKDGYFEEVKEILRSRPDYVPENEHGADPELKEHCNALLRAVEQACGYYEDDAPGRAIKVVDDPDVTLEEAERRGWKKVGMDDVVDLSKGNTFHVIKKEGSAVEATKIDTAKPKGPKEEKALEMMSVAMEEFSKWTKANQRFVLQANECSRMHKMIESVSVSGVSVVVSERPEENWLEHEYADWKEVKTFVVKHDWCAAFGESLGTIADTELYLPYPNVAFEFKISNRVIIALVQTKTDNSHHWMYFAETSNGVWLAIEDLPKQTSPLFDVVRAQVKAICVMLDSKVAETQVVRQPTALNEKRAKTGKLPLYDYHIVDLSRRHRAARPLGSGAPTGRHVRCHFRRGHWRHFEKHRTWINWMLVGDPDLGFVEKEYKL